MLRKNKRSTFLVLALKHLPGKLRQRRWLLTAAHEQNRTETVQRAGITCVQTWPFKWHLQDLFFRESFDKNEAWAKWKCGVLSFFLRSIHCVFQATITTQRTCVSRVKEKSADVLYRCIHLAVLTGLQTVSARLCHFIASHHHHHHLACGPWKRVRACVRVWLGFFPHQFHPYSVFMHWDRTLMHVETYKNKLVHRCQPFSALTAVHERDWVTEC